jgi:glycosyltransferase involved in cell wall biosynthesis
VHHHRGRTAVEPADWVSVLSRYDAGWLHPVASTNGGDIRAATWDDLNLPARLPTLLAAGLPLILPRSDGCVHAAQRLASELGVAVLYRDLDDLAEQLRDAPAMDARRERAWAVREELTFDRHADRLASLLREAGAR